MPSSNQQHWALTVPIQILRGLEGALTVPPQGQKLLTELQSRPVAPEPEVDEHQEFAEAMSGADNAPDRRMGLLERMRPHLAVLGGTSSAETEFGRWVLEQMPWLFTLKDEDFKHLARWPRLGALSIHQSRISGAALENLAAAVPGLKRLLLSSNILKAPFWVGLVGLRGLETLELMGQKGFADADLEHVMVLPRLKKLTLAGRSLSQAGLKQLAKHETLEVLETSPIDEEALIALAGANSVRRVRTPRCPITDDGLKRLAAVKPTRLRELLFAGCPEVTDTGAAALATMSPLTHLCLWHAKITNSGVGELAKLTNLVELDIGSCSKVTDKAVPALEGMKGLKMLRVTGTKISPEGLGNLGMALRGCNLVTRG